MNGLKQMAFVLKSNLPNVYEEINLALSVTYLGWNLFCHVFRQYKPVTPKRYGIKVTTNTDTDNIVYLFHDKSIDVLVEIVCFANMRLTRKWLQCMSIVKEPYYRRNYVQNEGLYCKAIMLLLTIFSMKVKHKKPCCIYS